MRAAALLLLLGPAAPLLQDADSGGWPAYAALVERYRSGDHRGAVAEPLAPAQALEHASALKRLAESAQRCPSCEERVRYEAFPFEAAVLLHTDRGIERLDQRDPAGAAELEVASRLVAVMPPPRRTAFEPRWLRAAALALSKRGQWDQALPLLDLGLRLYAGDARLHLAWGAVLESRAWIQDGAGADLSEAEKSYRAALALDPGLAQARVRLGRTLELLGRPKEAATELQAAVKAARSVPDQYLAHLFLGRARESAGDWTGSIAAYDEATRVEPDGQAAAVALSYALDRAGRRRESVEALRAGVARGGGRLEVDPWWPYLAGQCDDSDAMLEALRLEAGR